MVYVRDVIQQNINCYFYDTCHWRKYKSSLYILLIPNPYQIMRSHMKKTARYRAKIKAKKTKERLRKRGFLKVRVPGQRMKRVHKGRKER